MTNTHPNDNRDDIYLDIERWENDGGNNRSPHTSGRQSN